MDGADPRSRRQSVAAVLATVLILGTGFRVQAWRSQRVNAPLPVPENLGSLPFFVEDVTAAAGIDHRHEVLDLHPTLAHVDKFITAIGGAAVAVVDYDGDGWQDIYLTTMKIGAPNRLFANRRNATFEEVATEVGLADVNRDAGSLRPLFFDFENDGDRDLLLTTTYCPRVFRNDGGTFSDITRTAGISHCGFASASNTFDFDDDGDQDLVIADFYKPVDLQRPAFYDFMPHSWYTAANGGPVHVYRNNGDASFTAVPGNLGIDQAEWHGWVHAIGAYDLRGHGGTDLYFAVDFNYQDRLFYDLGPGSLRDASSLLEQKYSHSSMNAEIADFRNIDRPGIYVTDIHAPGWVPGENLLWDVRPDGDSVHDASKEAGVARCGWAWGAKFADLDNDGWQDLVVTNGFFAGDPGRQYWYQTAILQGGHNSFTEDARRWPPIEGRSMASFQRSCVYRNEGGRFTDVVDQTAMRDDRSDGRGVASIDLLNDGSLSLVVANLSQPAQLYRNHQNNENRWIGFELTGTRSGTDAFGAKVTVKLEGGGVLTRELRPTNGYLSQSDPRLHFGLGADPKIESITVRWPSGLAQPLSGLAPGKYHRIREPDAAEAPPA
jgi:hypothetical protein